MPSAVNLVITAKFYKVPPSYYFPDKLKSGIDRFGFDHVCRVIYQLWLPEDEQPDLDED